MKSAVHLKLLIFLGQFFTVCATFGLKRTYKADAAGENTSFIFTEYVKSVPRYNFKLAYTGLHIAVKELFETQF